MARSPRHREAETSGHQKKKTDVIKQLRSDAPVPRRVLESRTRVPRSHSTAAQWTNINFDQASLRSFFLFWTPRTSDDLAEELSSLRCNPGAGLLEETFRTCGPR
mmetsp:Transcript_27538/g.72601  ORF Transcript_27538/g.72601 Transcript_27538/m.72601 type:complete len:105 (-) Transcript_27538:553-867(-)